MSELELRITFSNGVWVAQWLQDGSVLFDVTGESVAAALANLVNEVGTELAAVTGGVSEDDE